MPSAPKVILLAIACILAAHASPVRRETIDPYVPGVGGQQIVVPAAVLEELRSMASLTGTLATGRLEKPTEIISTTSSASEFASATVASGTSTITASTSDSYTAVTRTSPAPALSTSAAADSAVLLPVTSSSTVGTLRRPEYIYADGLYTVRGATRQPIPTGSSDKEQQLSAQTMSQRRA